MTYDDWDACLRGKGCDGYLPDNQGWGFGKRPVIRVSFHDAQHYVAWLRRRTGKDYRLPSEAEWEYAARAGTTTPFWTGERLDSNQANFHEHARSPETASRKGRYRGMTVEVDEPPFTPNAFGLFQTAGNVWEWVGLLLGELPRSSDRRDRLDTEPIARTAFCAAGRGLRDHAPNDPPRASSEHPTCNSIHSALCVLTNEKDASRSTCASRI